MDPLLAAFLIAVTIAALAHGARRVLAVTKEQRKHMSTSTIESPATRRARWTRWMRATAEHGNVVSAAILLIMAILLLLACIQGALYYHARSLAVAAAEESLRQSAVQHGSAAAGTAAAYAFIAASGPGVLQAPVVHANRSATTATTTITGKTPSLIWFWHPVVEVRMTKTVERITTPGVPT